MSEMCNEILEPPLVEFPRACLGLIENGTSESFSVVEDSEPLFAFANNGPSKLLSGHTP